MGHRRAFVSLFASAILIFLIASCSPPGKSPVIDSFTADRETIVEGESVILGWAISGATRAEITPTVGAVAVTQGSVTVMPTETTAYVLRASNSHGSTTRTITITVTPAPAGPVVTRVTVSPAQTTLGVGDSRLLTATAAGSGDFDDTVTWSSSDPAVASVDAAGRVTAQSAGTVTITATSNETPAVTGTATVIVTEEPVDTAVTSVTVTPGETTLAVTETQQLDAAVAGTGDFDDTVTWSSSNEAVALVSSSGLVTAQSAGTAVITATSVETPAVSGTATITVTGEPAEPLVTAVSVTPSTATIAVAGTQQLAAAVAGTGDFDDTVTWSSSNEAVALVSSSGLVTAQSAGSAVITATSNQTTTVSGSATITVTAASAAACSDPAQVITFPDALVDAAVRGLYSVAAGEPVTCDDVQQTITSITTDDGQETNNVLFLSRTESDTKVTSLEGLQHLSGLRRLELAGNNLTNISQLAGMTGLVELNLDTNDISDLSPLAGLTNLAVLGFYDNLVEDLGPLTGLTNLEILYASFNRIHDLTPLAGLTSLEHLWLLFNCRTVSGDDASDCLSDIDPASGLDQLLVLLITGNEVDDISAVAGLTSLVMLDASANLIEDISALGSLADLATVRLIDNPVHSLAPLAANTGFMGPRTPYVFDRGGVVLPLRPDVVFHNLDLGFNCLLDDPDNPAHVTTIESREMIVDGEEDAQNDPARSGCTVAAPESAPASLSGPTFRQQFLQQLRGDR